MREAAAVDASPATSPPATTAVQPSLDTASRPSGVGSRKPAGRTRIRAAAGALGEPLGEPVEELLEDGEDCDGEAAETPRCCGAGVLEHAPSANRAAAMAGSARARRRSVIA
ncbi:hypothetical protein JCM18899A_23490 [Nocardioides sp. AN3]